MTRNSPIAAPRESSAATAHATAPLPAACARRADSFNWRRSRKLATQALVLLLAQREDLPNHDLRRRRGRDRDDGPGESHELRHEENAQRRDERIDVPCWAEEPRTEDAAFPPPVEDEIDTRDTPLHRPPRAQPAH